MGQIKTHNETRALLHTHSAATRRTAQASKASSAGRAAVGTVPARASHAALLPKRVAVGGEAAQPAPFAAPGYTTGAGSLEQN